MAAEPPDLVALTGDIVYEDPDDVDDRSFARAVFADLPCPLVAIPGNHDIGFYGEDDQRPERLAAFVDTWGSDRFAVDAAGWRLVGANAYLLGDPEHDGWLRDAVDVERPVAVFIHQPVVDESRRRLGDARRRRLWPSMPRSTAPTCASSPQGTVTAMPIAGATSWAPSTTIPGEDRDEWSDPRSAPSSSRSSRRRTPSTHRLIQRCP